MQVQCPLQALVQLLMLCWQEPAEGRTQTIDVHGGTGNGFLRDVGLALTRVGTLPHDLAAMWLFSFPFFEGIPT
jgi:hypothetical protein